MSPTDPPSDAQMREALARDVDRVTRRVDDLETVAARVGELEPLAQQVAELDRLVNALGNDVTELIKAPHLQPRAWLQVTDPEDARSVLTDLVEWLDSVYLRYPGARLPVCWMWHPTVVEELWWLRNAHADAYAGRGWSARAAQWHHQLRPGVVERIRAVAGTCDLREHVSGGQKAVAPLAAPLAGHVEAVVEAWVSTGLPPEPSGEQLEDAREYEELQSRPRPC